MLGELKWVPAELRVKFVAKQRNLMLLAATNIWGMSYPLPTYQSKRIIGSPSQKPRNLPRGSLQLFEGDYTHLVSRYYLEIFGNEATIN